MKKEDARYTPMRKCERGSIFRQSVTLSIFIIKLRMEYKQVVNIMNRTITKKSPMNIGLVTSDNWMSFKYQLQLFNFNIRLVYYYIKNLITRLDIK